MKIEELPTRSKQLFNMWRKLFLITFLAAIALVLMGNFLQAQGVTCVRAPCFDGFHCQLLCSETFLGVTVWSDGLGLLRIMKNGLGQLQLPSRCGEANNWLTCLMSMSFTEVSVPLTGYKIGLLRTSDSGLGQISRSSPTRKPLVLLLLCSSSVGRTREV